MTHRNRYIPPARRAHLCRETPHAGTLANAMPFADKKYMTFGFTQQANLTVGQGAPHQLMECAWYFTALDGATEARLSAIIGKVAS